MIWIFGWMYKKVTFGNKLKKRQENKKNVIILFHSDYGRELGEIEKEGGPMGRKNT